MIATIFAYTLATLLAAFVPAISLSYGTDLGVSWYNWVIVIYPFSAVLIFAIGTPAYLLFDEFGYNKKLPAMLFGAAASALVAALLPGQSLQIKTLVVFSIIGSVTGFVYWFVHNRFRNFHS